MYLVFDIGGTNMRVGVSADGQSIKESKIIPTPKDFEQGIQVLKQAADELSKGEKIERVAGGIAGALDRNKTMLTKSAHVAGWAGKPLKQELERVFETGAKLENDTAIEGLGEVTHGVGKGIEIAAYVNIGTGVGGVRIVDGKIDRNGLGFEPGHQIIVPDGNPCTCGGRGHFESYVSGAYFEGLYHQKGEEITDPKIWDEISRYVGIGLTNITVHWSPDIIILGGAVARRLTLDKVKIYLEEFLTVFPSSPPVVLGKLNHDAGLYGALELLK